MNPLLLEIIVVVGFFIYFSLVTIFLFYLDRRYPVIAGFDKTFFRDIWSDISWGFGLFFISLSVSFVYSMLRAAIMPIFNGNEISLVKPMITTQIDSINDSAPSLVILICFILFPFFEEIFHRGFIQDRLSKIFSPIFALFAQAICFTLGHPFNIGTIQLFCMAMIFGYWRYKRRTLLPVIMAHSMWNIVAFFVIGKNINI